MASISLSLLLSFARVESKRETRDDRKRKNKTKSLAEIQIMSRRSSALEEDDKTPRQRLFFREKTEGERERERERVRKREREREKERKRETHRTFCFFFVRKFRNVSKMCQKCRKTSPLEQKNFAYPLGPQGILLDRGRLNPWI